MVIILFGVSGAGKTVVGRLLAEKLGWPFYDADDFHSATNVEKLRQGVSLTDADRKPWLESLSGLIERSLAKGEDAVLACSALKKAYRSQLKAGAEVKLVYLRGDYALIARRLRQRRGHFMDPALLQSQFADLEEPDATENAMVIAVNHTPPEIIDEIQTKLKR